MREYEILYIVHPDREGDLLKEVVGKYSDLVSSQGGEVLKVEEWSKQKLAYPIRKCSKGLYVLMNYLAPAQLTRELERILRLDELVLKFLTVKLSDNPDPEKRRQEVAAAKAKAEEQRAPSRSDDDSSGGRRPSSDSPKKDDSVSKPEVTPEAKPEATAEAKPEATPEGKSEAAASEAS